MLLAAACSSEPEAPAPATGPVAVPAPTRVLDDAQARACAELLAALPDEVDPGVERRPVEGDADRTAAWGDPPVVLTCGVDEPDRPDQPVQVNGVRWSVRDIGAGFRWTTEELAVPVSVEIPDAYENAGELVNPLAEPLLQTLAPASPAASSAASPSPAPAG